MNHGFALKQPQQFGSFRMIAPHWKPPYPSLKKGQSHDWPGAVMNWANKLWAMIGQANKLWDESLLLLTKLPASTTES